MKLEFVGANKTELKRKFGKINAKTANKIITVADLTKCHLNTSK